MLCRFLDFLEFVSGWGVVLFHVACSHLGCCVREFLFIRIGLDGYRRGGLCGLGVSVSMLVVIIIAVQTHVLMITPLFNLSGRVAACDFVKNAIQAGTLD